MKIFAEKEYLVTGRLKGRSYSKKTSNYEHAIQSFSNNNLKCLWQLDCCPYTGRRLKRTLINKNRG